MLNYRCLIVSTLVFCFNFCFAITEVNAQSLDLNTSSKNYQSKNKDLSGVNIISRDHKAIVDFKKKQQVELIPNLRKAVKSKSAINPTEKLENEIDAVSNKIAYLHELDQSIPVLNEILYMELIKEQKRIELMAIENAH